MRDTKRTKTSATCKLFVGTVSGACRFRTAWECQRECTRCLAAAVLRDIASRQPSMEECYRRIQLVKATKHFVVKCVLSDQREIATLMNVHVVAALTTTMRKR